MPSIKTLSMVILALVLAIVLVYSIHSLYLARNGVTASSSYVNSVEYEELMNNYTNLLIKYTALLQKLNECMTNESSIQYQGSLSHKEVIASNLIMSATLSITSCNGYTLQSTKDLYFETKGGPGYLVITYRLSNPPQVIEVQYRITYM